MPRYFFNAYNAFGFARDEEGKELPNLHDARAVAVDAARSLISADVRSGSLDLNGRIEVTDETGRILLSIDFSQAIETKRSSGGESAGA
jgi:hypothetical protein